MNISMKKEKLFSLLACVLFASCATKELRTQEYSVGNNASNTKASQSESYQIGPEDVLGVLIWKEPSLSGTVKVRPDGFVTLPLVNEVRVTGLTTSQVRKILEQRYKEFVFNPTVSIRIEDISSNEVFVVGQVTKPGAYPMTGNDTLLQALTRAGGLTIFAGRRDIKVMRRDGPKVLEYTADYNAILKGDLSQDITLKPGDRIIVP